jgi:uncharacterized membrane protein YjjB (DUF3815 family)
MDLYEIGTYAAVCVGIVMGWVTIGLLRFRIRPFVWVLLTIVVATVGVLGMTTTLIGAFGLGRLANTAIASFCIGAVGALWRRLRRERRNVAPAATR